jgi:hypothetical protein
MAGESTYSAISGLVQNIVDGALLTASENTVMTPLVNVMTDQSSLAPRVFSGYTGGTIVALAEISDLTAQTFTPAANGTVTPSIFGQQYYLTDARINSDPFGAQRDASADLGRVFGVKVDSSLTALFSSFTGGTVGTAGGTLTWANVQRSAAYLRANYAPGNYICVLRPEHWYYLTSASSGVPTLMQSPAWMDSLAANFYQGSWGGIDFFVDGNITAGTAAVAGMFHSDALVYDQRKAFGIEVQRDASRGGGGYELNATIWFGAGIYRATFGVQMIGTSA